MRETPVQSLGWEDPLEKEMATTPVLLPGKSHGWRSLVGYSPWGHKESDTTEQLQFLSFSEVSTVIIPILQIRNRHRKIQWLVQNHTCKRGSQNIKPCTLMLTYYGLWTLLKFVFKNNLRHHLWVSWVSVDNICQFQLRSFCFVFWASHLIWGLKHHGKVLKVSK